MNGERPATASSLPAALPAVAARARHAALAPLEALRERKQPLQLLQAYDRLLDQYGRLKDPTVDEQVVWLGATRLTAETALETGLADQATAVLQKAVAQFQAPAWQHWRESTAKYYREMLHLAVRMKHYQDALDLFNRARAYLEVDQESRNELARAAAHLGSTDLGSAQLYLELLREGAADAEERRIVLGLLRRALRIDLRTPAGELEQLLDLNGQMAAVEDLPWVAAHRAMAALCLGRPLEALQIADEVKGFEESDADALILLGTVSYLCRRWADALERFTKAADVPGAAQGPLALYVPLCRLNLLLGGHDDGYTHENFAQFLEADTNAATAALRDDELALDAAWIVGAACALLGRDDEALKHFAAAPSEYATWRHAQAEVETLWRQGKAAEVGPRLQALAAQAPAAAPLVRLLRAQDALSRSALVEAGELIEAGAKPGKTPFDADLPAVRECVRLEIALSQPAAVPVLPHLTTPDEVSGAVKAWYTRLAARWYLDRGQEDVAADRLRQPLHRLVPAQHVRHLEAVRAGLLGDDAEAGPRFEQLAAAPAARPVHRLEWALWLCGQKKHAEARAYLDAHAAILPDGVERKLAEAECHLADGGDPARAKQILVSLANPAVWAQAPRLALFRPWQRPLPRETWQHQAGVSMHRVGDMLHATELMLRADLLASALTTLAAAEQHLGAPPPALTPHLGRPYRQAANVELQRGHFDEACWLHAKAAGYGDADADFAVRLAAAAIETDAGQASDQAFELLRSWIATFQGDDAALEAGPAGKALERFLFIDAATPESPVELERRTRWTRQVHEARPGWDWPKRNLAREAARGSRHAEAVQLIEALGERTGEDHFLRGRAYWELRRFDEAFRSFSTAVEKAHGLPDSRAWRGCARAARRLEQLAAEAKPLDPAELPELLPDLDWRGYPAALAPLVRAWHGAVLVAARQGEKALEALQVDALDETVREDTATLRGFALLLAGKEDEALTLWQPAEDAAPRPVPEALRLVVLLQRPTRAQVQLVGKEIKRLRKRGVAHPLFHLADAQYALRVGDRVAAAEAAAAVARPPEEGWSPLLAPLPVFLKTEHEFVEARRAMQQGRFDEAAAVLENVAPRRLWPAGARYWQALCLVQAGRAKEGEELLQAIVAGDAHHADAHAQLALLRARGNQADAAAGHARQALEVEADHPFARLALAEIHEARGDVIAARADYEEVAKQDVKRVGGRTLAAAFLALGRLQQQAGEPDAAEHSYRQAAKLRPEWPAAPTRLGLLLATHAPTPEKLAEAETLLAAAAKAAAKNPRLALAQATVAQKLGKTQAVAGHLERLLAVPGFTKWPAETRRGVALWSVDAQLALKRYKAAAEALEQQAQAEPAPAVEKRLVQCRLLQAIQLLQEVPLPDGALPEAVAALERVRAQDQGNPHAVLLALACRLLLGQAEQAETKALLEQVKATTFAGDRLQLLAATARLLGGDQAAAEETEKLLAGLDDPATARALKLLVANQRKETGKLEAEAQQALDGGAAWQEHAPLDAADVVLAAALGRAGKQQLDGAVKLLEQWHGQGQGSPRSRLAHSQLLAKLAVRALKGRKVKETKDRLHEALAVLTESNPAVKK